jgi:hypothetical protein
MCVCVGGGVNFGLTRESEGPEMWTQFSVCPLFYCNSNINPPWSTYAIILTLKGQSHEVFDPRFFS